METFKFGKYKGLTYEEVSMYFLLGVNKGNIPRKSECSDDNGSSPLEENIIYNIEINAVLIAFMKCYKNIKLQINN